MATAIVMQCDYFPGSLFLRQEKEEVRESEDQCFTQISYEEAVKEFSCYSNKTKQPLNTLDVNML